MSDDAKKDAKRQKKEDARYLNSTRRLVGRLVGSVFEYVVVMFLVVALASYMQDGSFTLDFDSEMLRPGGLVFDALVAYLPILVLANIGVYFGEGTKGRLVFSVLRYVAVAVFFYVLLESAGTSLEIPSIASGQGLDSIEIDVAGIAKLMIFVMLVCVIIPVGEYIGARKKHREAQERKDAGYE